jgi:heat shock protein HslJ
MNQMRLANGQVRTVASVATLAIAFAVLVLFVWQARTADNEPFDGNWQLVDEGRLAKVNPKPTIAIKKSLVVGSTGCNNFSFGIKRREESAVEIADFSMTRVLCSDAVDDLEKYLVTQFQKTKYIERRTASLCFLSGERYTLLSWSMEPPSGEPAKQGSRVDCDAVRR